MGPNCFGILTAIFPVFHPLPTSSPDELQYANRGRADKRYATEYQPKRRRDRTERFADHAPGPGGEGGKHGDEHHFKANSLDGCQADCCQPDRDTDCCKFHDSSTAASAPFLRRFDCKIFWRRRSDFGVISANSSSAMNSMACSRFICWKGTRRIASSAVEARMLVSFFSRTAFTSRSLSLAFSPTIMPSYSSTQGPTKSSPRSCRPHRA